MKYDFSVSILESRNPAYAGDDVISFEVSDLEEKQIRDAKENGRNFSETAELEELYERVYAAYICQLEDEVRDNGMFEDEYPDDYDEDDDPDGEILEEYREELINDYLDSVGVVIEF